ETTALGAAYLAGLSAGLWPSVGELTPLWEEDRTFEPRWGEAERLERLERWRRAVARTLDWELPG
ncbi:MAG: glycerol kinase, partial [Dehalococcoidia bacterium]|nr:glycerol kinase [Dehalococcoidia bacterium]